MNMVRDLRATDSGRDGHEDRARCQLEDALGERGGVAAHALDANPFAGGSVDIFAISQIDARVVHATTSTP